MGPEDDAPETIDPPPTSVNAENTPVEYKHSATELEADDFGLPRTNYRAPRTQQPKEHSDEEDGDTFHDAQDVKDQTPDPDAFEEKPEPRVDRVQERESEVSQEKAVLADKNPQSASHPISSLEDGEMPTAQIMVRANAMNAPKAA